MRTPDDSRPEQADAAFVPFKDLLNKLREKVLPQIAEQEPTSRRVMLAELELDLCATFKELDDLETELRELRKRFADLRKASRSLRPRGQFRHPPKGPARQPTSPQPLTEQDKDRVYAALPSDGRARTLHDLFVLTGFGLSKLKRILNVLEKENAVERLGSTSGTRYRVRWSRG